MSSPYLPGHLSRLDRLAKRIGGGPCFALSETRVMAPAMIVLPRSYWRRTNRSPSIVEIRSERFG